MGQKEVCVYLERQVYHPTAKITVKEQKQLSMCAKFLSLPCKEMIVLLPLTPYLGIFSTLFILPKLH